LCALAELTGYPVAFFVRPAEAHVELEWTSARFHIKGWKPSVPVLAFKDGAREAMVQGRLW
jgi:hypothetical protein